MSQNIHTFFRELWKELNKTKFEKYNTKPLLISLFTFLRTTTRRDAYWLHMNSDASRQSVVRRRRSWALSAYIHAYV